MNDYLKQTTAIAAVMLSGFFVGKTQVNVAYADPPEAKTVQVSKGDPEWMGLIESKKLDYRSSENDKFVEDLGLKPAKEEPFEKDDVLAVVVEPFMWEHPWEQHKHYVAAISNAYADDAAGKDVCVICIHGSLIGFDMQDEVLEILKEAEVLNYSMSSTNPNLHLDSVREKLWDRWENDLRGVIVVASAGNDGDFYSSTDIAHPQEYSLVKHSPNAVIVGAAVLNADGDPVVEEYSTGCGPTCVSLRPEDGKFQYVSDYIAELIENKMGKQLRMEADNVAQEKFDDRFDDVLKQAIEDAECAKGGAIAEDEKDRIKEEVRESLRAQTADEAYQETLDKVVEKVRKSVERDLSADKQRDVLGENLSGTSFTSPVVMGLLAATEELYPELSDAQRIYALCASCDPVFERENGDELRYLKLDSGLYFNEVFAGFGVVNLENMVDMLDKLEAKRIEEPDAVKPVAKASSDNLQKIASLPQKTENRYEIEIEEDIAAVRFVLEFEVDSYEKSEVYVSSPDGTQVLLRPAAGYEERYRFTDDGEYIRQERDSDFGIVSSPAVITESSKGSWVITTGENMTIKDAKLTVYGVERGDLIEKVEPPKRELEDEQLEKGRFRLSPDLPPPPPQPPNAQPQPQPAPQPLPPGVKEVPVAPPPPPEPPDAGKGIEVRENSSFTVQALKAVAEQLQEQEMDWAAKVLQSTAEHVMSR